MPIPTLQGFQLSSQQKRLWLLQQDNSTYLTQAAIAIKGDLQPAKLKQVLETIVDRHQILRTNFRRRAGIKLPVMIISDRDSFSWQEINLCGRSVNLSELFDRARKQPYNLETEPVLRIYLYQIEPSHYILQIALPSLCGDRWTLKNLFNEIVDCYGDKDNSAEELQYVQFSEWQNQLLTDEDAEAAKQFWQQQQLTSLAGLRLPVENKPLKQSGWGIQTLDLPIALEVRENLETIAQQYQTTKETILLACWQILIWRLTNESSIVIGRECDRREYEEMHSMMGLLATWLPIKGDFTDDLTFAEVLATLEKTLESVGEWEDYFVIESRDRDDLAFPIGFEWQELPTFKDAKGISFSWLKQSSCIEKYKLKLSVIASNNSLSLELDGDRTYFSLETIDSIAKQLQTLIEDVVRHPESKIGRLAILPESDRQKLFQFNQTAKDYPQNKSIQQLFEEQVAKTPHNTAVVFEEQQLTYAQLNSQANRLAHYLTKQGVGSEVLVGLYLEKSPLAIIGLLGILKAGGAYLPLDANLPTEALSDRISATQIILTQQNLVSKIPPSITEIICLDADWEKISEEDETNLPDRTNQENLAYVLYTSGSTGKSKGVAIEQRQLLNYYYAVTDRLNLAENKSFALVSSLAADLGNTVIFPALLTGGCLHLISTEISTNPAAFAEYNDRHSLDCLKIVPSHLNALLSAAEPEKVLPKKCLILGGEALNWQLVDKIQQYQSEYQIFNHYAPTEATVGVLTHGVKETGRLGDEETGGRGEKETVYESATVPLGKPLANNQIYLLDRNLQPVPIGVPGEIYIGGAQVSRGYLNLSGLTAERFIQFDGQRLYKTGDKARYLPSGDLEFLGRIDNQVKIRGYRIELGEIETALQQHPNVKTAIAIATPDKSNRQRLVAYIVPESRQIISDKDLQDFLAQKLPDYTIPKVWVQLETLPLTSNGKVDRQALPAPESVKLPSSKTFVAPRNPTEAILADIWAKVLEIEQISIEDNFFELGGDSILSIQIVAKISQAGLQVTPKQIFEYPTIAYLAAVVTTKEKDTDTATIPENNYQLLLPELKGKIPASLVESIEDIYQLTPIQKGILFHSLYDGENGLYLFQATFTIKTPLNIDAFAQAWQQVVERHSILRTGFYWQDISEALQVVFDRVTTSLEYFDWREIQPDRQQEQLNSFLDSDRSSEFDLTKPCPMRLNLFHLADDTYEFVWTRHFIVADGWSVQLLLNEVMQIYQSICEGRELALSPSTSFGDYARWLQTKDTSQAEQFWRKMLKGVKNTTPLTNLYGCNERSPEYQDREITLSTATTTALHSFVKQHQLTLNTLMQGVWAILLGYYSSQRSVIYGCTVFGRPPELRGVESMAGMLLNTLPVKVNVAPQQAIVPWLQELQKLLVATREYEYTPLVELKAWSEIPPSLPLFESIVVFENLPEPESLREDKRALEIADSNTFYKINYPISVVIVPEVPLVIGINYDFDLIDVATVDAILKHFKGILEFIINNPNSYLQDIEISLATEKQQQIAAMLEQQVTFDFDNCSLQKQ